MATRRGPDRAADLPPGARARSGPRARSSAVCKAADRHRNFLAQRSVEMGATSLTDCWPGSPRLHYHAGKGGPYMRPRFVVLASLLAALVAVSVPAIASAAPRHNRGLTINATPNPIIAGDGVLIYGQLRGSDIANKPVVLYHRLATQPRFTIIGVTRTDSHGFYEFTRAEGVVLTNRSWFVRGPEGRPQPDRPRARVGARRPGRQRNVGLDQAADHVHRSHHPRPHGSDRPSAGPEGRQRQLAHDQDRSDRTAARTTRSATAGGSRESATSASCSRATPVTTAACRTQSR